jgi:hypothetical protein
MSRFVLVFALGLCAALAPAAPVPRAEAQKELMAKLWGTPEGQGEFELRGKELTIRAPVRSDFVTVLQVPQVARKVKGDFVATVRVLDATGPNYANSRGGSDYGTHVGLRVWCGDVWANSWLTQYHAQCVGGGVSDTVTRQPLAELFDQTGGEGVGGDCLADGAATILRIARRGNVLTYSSSDGTKWSEPHTPQRPLVLPDEVFVGVAALPSRYRAVCATFADLTIEPLKAKK